MDIPSSKKARASLKEFFRKNRIPTESNFGDLIEAGVNQRDDGLVKARGAPLSIEAGGDDASQKRTLEFYSNFQDAQPSVVFNLNPFATPGDPSTKATGLGISPASGETKVFVEPAAGRLGLSTVEPRAPLDVRAAADGVWISAGPGGDGGRATLGFGGAGNPAAPVLALSDMDDPPRVRFDNIGTGTEAAPEFSSWIGLARGKTGDLAIVPGGNGNVGIGTAAPKHKLDVEGFIDAHGIAVNNGSNSGVGRGIRLWRENNTNHAIYLVSPGRPSPADKPAVQGRWDGSYRFRFRTHTGQGFLFENSSEAALVDIDADTGNLWTKGDVEAGGAIRAANSDIYFTEENHNHTAIGNAVGHAAIENAKNYNALMILGRNVPQPGDALHRVVKLWDELFVRGDLTIEQGSHRVKIGYPSRPYGHDGIRGEPNLWLDAAGRVIIKHGYTTNAMDVAERFPVDGAADPGDVMVYDADASVARRCTTDADPLVLGIVSGDPGMILGIDEDDVPVALCGRLKCKVDAGPAPIRAGDLLMTSATPAHGQKCSDAVAHQGAIIGKALEGLDSGTGEILVFVMPR